MSVFVCLNRNSIYIYVYDNNIPSGGRDAMSRGHTYTYIYIYTYNSVQPVDSSNLNNLAPLRVYYIIEVGVRVEMTRCFFAPPPATNIFLFRQFLFLYFSNQQLL